MTSHPRLALAGALSLFLAAPAAAQDWSTIRIASAGAFAVCNFPPRAGELAGFEIDLAADLCERMAAECELVAQAWDGIIPALQAGRYDAIMAGMSITDERREVITFSRPYVRTPASFVVTQDSPFADFDAGEEAVNMAQLTPEGEAAIAAIAETFGGSIIGVQTATTHENFLRTYLGDAAEIRSYDTQENLDLDLQSGRIDAALASMSYWVPLIESEQGQDLVLVGPAFSGGVFGEGIGVGIRQADADLADKFSTAIEAAIEDGTVSALSVEWFGFDSAARD